MSEPLPDSVGMGGPCPTTATQIDPRTRIRVWLRANGTSALLTAVTRRNSTTLTFAVQGDGPNDTTAEATEATAYPYVKGGIYQGQPVVRLDGRVFQSFHGDGTSGLSYVVEPLA